MGAEATESHPRRKITSVNIGFFIEFIKRVEEIKEKKNGGLTSILSLFRNLFNKFNKTGARMLDSVYHMTLKLFLIHIFGVKALGSCHMRDAKIVISYRFPKIYKILVVYRF